MDPEGKNKAEKSKETAAARLNNTSVNDCGSNRTVSRLRLLF